MTDISRMPPPTQSPDPLRQALQAALGAACRVDRELVGSGASRLFVVTQRLPRRTLVVKVLPLAGSDAGASDRFRREIAITAGLQHPNVLPVLKAGETAGMLYYVMPYVPEGSLRQRLDAVGRLPVAEALRVLRDLAAALAHAHAHGVVHGDVKPENVLLHEGRAVLADFGGARLRPRLTRGRDAGRRTPVVGTPRYMAPEQAAGATDVDARADVYALGVLGYELLAGRPPFVGPSPRDVLQAHLTQRVPPLRALRPDAPAALVAVLERALQKSPDARYAGGGALRAALAAAAPARLTAAPRPPRPAAPAWRPAGTRAPWHALAAGLLTPIVATLAAAAFSAASLGGLLGAALPPASDAAAAAPAAVFAAAPPAAAHGPAVASEAQPTHPPATAWRSDTIARARRAAELPRTAGRAAARERRVETEWRSVARQPAPAATPAPTVPADAAIEASAAVGLLATAPTVVPVAAVAAFVVEDLAPALGGVPGVRAMVRARAHAELSAAALREAVGSRLPDVQRAQRLATVVVEVPVRRPTSAGAAKAGEAPEADCALPRTKPGGASAGGQGAA